MKNDGVFTYVESLTRQYARAAAQVLLSVCFDFEDKAPFRSLIAFISCINKSCNLNRTVGRLMKREGERYRYSCRHTISQRSLYARSDFPNTCL